MDFKNQTELFNYLWEIKPHVSEISGEPLHPKGHWKWHWQFAHICEKSLYRKIKLSEDNIILLTPEEHHFFEHFKLKDKNKPMYLNHAENWEKLFAKKEQMKIQYHNTPLK